MQHTTTFSSRYAISVPAPDLINKKKTTILADGRRNLRAPKELQAISLC